MPPEPELDKNQRKDSLKPLIFESYMEMWINVFITVVINFRTELPCENRKDKSENDKLIDTKV